MYTTLALTVQVKGRSRTDASGYDGSEGRGTPDCTPVDLSVFPVRMQCGLVFGLANLWTGGVPTESVRAPFDLWCVVTGDSLEALADADDGYALGDEYDSLTAAMHAAEAEYGVAGVVMPSQVAWALTADDRAAIAAWLTEVAK